MTKMTKRDVLKTAIEFYETGGEPGMEICMDGVRCAYLTADGGRCAIGTLLPKMGFTDEEILEEFGGAALCDVEGKLRPHVEEELLEHWHNLSFLERMQSAHDGLGTNSEGSDVARALKKFAEDEGVKL